MLSSDLPESPDTPRYPSSLPVRLDVGGVTHPGLVRPNNEDQFFIARLTRSMETIAASLSPEDVPGRADEVNYVMVVADGMGGHAAGEVASRLAITELIHLALLLPDWIFRLDDQHRAEMEWRARGLLRQVDALLAERGAQDPALQGMGTTLTAARSLGRDLMIVHVGDSRAYLLRQDRLRRLTRDHTYAQVLADAGQIGSAEAAHSQLRHILTNVVGGSHDHVAVDIDVVELQDGDRVLLCSDGLTDVVDDETIAKAAAAGASSEACHRLIQLALDGGGRDNITVVVAVYSFPEERVDDAAS